jgi:hypothetical protein
MHMATAADWEAEAYRGHTVEAIRLYHLTHGVDLPQARAAVERWQSINLPPSSSYQRCVRVGRRVTEVLSAYMESAGRSIAYRVHIRAADPGELVGLQTLFLLDGAASSAPDLAIEIELPGVPPGLRRDVAAAHLADGVRGVWVIETADPTIHIFARALSHQTHRGDATFDGGDVLPGFVCPVKNLFG